MTFDIASKCESIVNAKDRFDRTPIFYAVEHQKFPDLLVRMLLLLGAQVNYIDQNRNTPLLLAVKRKDSLLTRRLAEFDVITMHMMIEECNLARGRNESMILMLDFLFAYGNKDQLSGRNRKGQSILHASACTGNMAVVELLIKHGIVDPQEIIIEVDKAGDTPLISASRGGWLDMTRFLVEDCHFNLSICSANGMTALHWAAHQGHTEIVSLLVNKGADITTPTKFGFTPLFLACDNQQDETGVFLLEKTTISTALSVKSVLGLGLTRVAAQRDCIKVLTKLIEYAGEDGNDAQFLSEQFEGCSHAFAAIYSNCHDSAMALLKADAAVEGYNSNRDTALHCAVANQDAILVKWLLEHSSEATRWLNSKNNKNQTPVDVAATTLQGAILADLLMHADAERVRDVDTRGWEGLHWATFYERLDLIKLLVWKSADVDAKDASGRTAAQLASVSFPEPMEMLQWLAPADTHKKREDLLPLQERVVSSDVHDVCSQVPAYIMDVYGRTTIEKPEYSIPDVLYKHGPSTIMSIAADIRQINRSLNSRWIHLPLNNVSTQCRVER